MQPTSIKMPKEIYEKVKAEANEQERSISGEIIYILKQYFKQLDRCGSQSSDESHNGLRLFE